jgi:hypothetical protein
LGQLWGENDERGVYKTVDAGELVIDPANRAYGEGSTMESTRFMAEKCGS